MTMAAQSAILSEENPSKLVGNQKGSEPMKMISWTQSAKGAGLMVRQYDYTVEPMVTVLLYMDGRQDAERLEKCFCIARRVCAELEEQGVKYDFRTNAALAGSLKEYADIDEGLGQHHFYKVLEYLGRGTYMCTLSGSVFLGEAVKDAGIPRGYIVIAADTSIYQCAGLAGLQDTGDGNLLILTEDCLEE